MEQISHTKPSPTIEMDINLQRNFIRFYSQLGEKPKTTVRFFDRTECYTVHGVDDTELISQIAYKSNVYIRKMLAKEADELPYLALHKHSFEDAVRELLLVRNFRVEVYVRKSTLSTWTLEYRGSPGNLSQFENIIFGDNEVVLGSVILSLIMRVESGAQRKLGLAAVEQNGCQFMVTEFIDDDFFTELEAIIVLLGPKECLLPSLDGEYLAIRTLLERNNVMVTLSKKSTASQSKEDLLQDLNRLLRFAKGQQEAAATLPERKLTIAMDALGNAIKYLNLLVDPSNFSQFELKQLNMDRFVHLDAAAVSALNVMPPTGSQNSLSRCESILGLLDHCRTPQGHRLLAQWVRQPLRSKEILDDRHNIVQCLMESPSTLDALHSDHLRLIPDVVLLTKKVIRGKATLQDLHKIYRAILRTPWLVNDLLSLENSSVKSVLCDPLKSCLEDLSGLRQMVEQVIDLESIEKGEYLVKASFDDQLGETKRRMIELVENMERLAEKASADLNLERSQIRLDSVPHLGHHFRITLKDDSVLRKAKKYRILDVVKGGVRFTTDTLADCSEEFESVHKEYEEQQKSIVDEIIKVASGYASPLTSLNIQVAQVDCLVSFAVAAQKAPMPYVRPKMLSEESGLLIMKHLRHPCLELQEGVTFIANDVEFKRDECNMLIITGPNMGGKSTYIRSVGTAVLMAHVGSFVPCSEATITMVDAILGRVGAGDNFTKGLSTFMMEMVEAAGIIRTVTNKSLAIIDELGRGTSTYEGCGIAWSIAEHLAKEAKCFALFSTHFHEITVLAESVRSVKNCHMAAIVDGNDFTLLYQVKPGPMESSFGIQAARFADFPDDVLQWAEMIYGEFEDVHASKRSTDDDKVLEKIGNAIDELTKKSKATAIQEDDLAEMVEDFQGVVQKSNSEYFKAILKTAADAPTDIDIDIGSGICA